MLISDVMSGDKPISVAEGRHGELIVAQEGSVPIRVSQDGSSSLAGIPAPESAPSLTASPTKSYYVARTDVTKPGAVYYAPPEVSYEFDCAPAPPSHRPAVGRAYLEQASVSEIDNRSGGKYYPCEPTVSLSGTHGSGAVIKAELDSPAVLVSDPNNSSDTGLTGFALISDGPPWPDEQALPEDMSEAIYAIWEYVDIPISGNGIQRVTGPRRWFSATNGSGNLSQYFIEMTTDVEVLGYTSGSGAIVRVTALGHQYIGADCTSNFCFFNFRYATLYGDAVPYKMGKDYDPDAEIMIAIPAASVFDPEQNIMVAYDSNAADTKVTNALHWQKAMVIRAYSGGDARNPGGGVGYPIRDLAIENGGSGYLVAPQLKIISSTGFGAYATCTVSNGVIDTVTLENGGGGYKTRPEVKVMAGGAEAFAVSRPHLRGLYQCYYRYTDDAAESLGGPVPGNLSAVRELDAGEGTSGVTWSFAAPTSDRVTHVELWRSTSGQATTLYRVARLSAAEGEPTTFFDDLTDDELRDPDRTDYAAMPILLPNGELNAMRFVRPPAGKSAVVRFQDRMWYGVGGDQLNAIYYSEVDEPESVPGENEVVVQQNSREFDSLQAMIPFGSTLFLAQRRHLFSLTFSQIPALDGQVAPVAYRGCLSQRCWAIHEGYAYIADRYGMYRINQSGAVEDLTAAVHDQFEDKIDFVRTTWNFLAVDHSSHTVRFFLVHKDDGESEHPTRALCYDVASQTLWWEKYPQPITSAAVVELSDGSEATVYAGAGGLYLLDAGPSDASRGSIVRVNLTDRGKGYKAPPSVTAVGGYGAQMQASLNADGEVSAIWILDPGFGYTSGDLVIGLPDDTTVPPEERRQAVASFSATSLTADTLIWPTFHFKTGRVEYPSDADDKNGGQEQRRDLRLYYQPTDTSNELSVRMYYNGSKHPRINVAERDRGTGFVDSVVDPAARIDTGYMMEHYGQDSGAARAIRTGKTMEDIRSGDRDVAIEICGPSRGVPVLFYSVDVFGGAQ
jgi:hypothetical protein